MAVATKASISTAQEASRLQPVDRRWTERSLKSLTPRLQAYGSGRLVFTKKDPFYQMY